MEDAATKESASGFYTDPWFENYKQLASGYTLDELLTARASIDELAYAERTKFLSELIEQRKLEEESKEPAVVRQTEDAVPAEPRNEPLSAVAKWSYAIFGLSLVWLSILALQCHFGSKMIQAQLDDPDALRGMKIRRQVSIEEDMRFADEAERLKALDFDVEAELLNQQTMLLAQRDMYVTLAIMAQALALLLSLFATYKRWKSKKEYKWTNQSAAVGPALFYAAVVVIFVCALAISFSAYLLMPESEPSGFPGIQRFGR
ncbi:MAG: hypothetical protein NUW37_20115 [Planctomycetes bacterium]|nr:hypothetical protein [Planctomycetota bacterium]